MAHHLCQKVVYRLEVVLKIGSDFKILDLVLNIVSGFKILALVFKS